MNATALDRFQTWLVATPLRRAIVIAGVLGSLTWTIIQYLP